MQTDQGPENPTPQENPSPPLTSPQEEQLPSPPVEEVQKLSVLPLVEDEDEDDFEDEDEPEEDSDLYDEDK